MVNETLRKKWQLPPGYMGEGWDTDHRKCVIQLVLKNLVRCELLDEVETMYF